MSRTTKILIAAILGIIGFSLLVFAGYYQRIKFHKPLSVEVQGHALPSSLQMRGITPLGKVYTFVRNTDDEQWHIGHTFLSAVVIESDIVLSDTTDTLIMKSENKMFKLALSELLYKGTDIREGRYVHMYHLPDHISDTSFIGAFVSVFRWKSTQVFLLLCFGIVLLFVLFLRIRKHLKHFSYKKHLPVMLYVVFSLMLLIAVMAEYVRFKIHGPDGAGILQALLFLIASCYLTHMMLVIITLLMRSHKTLRYNLSVFMGVLCLTLCVAEIGLRRLGIYQTYTEAVFGTYATANFTPPGDYYLTTPDITTSLVVKDEFVFHRRFNSDGLPDDEFKLPKDSGVYRILALGDSFTEGIGAPLDSSWSSLLPMSLKKSLPDLKLDVMNAGISGSDPFFAYFLLRDKLLKFKPDMVLMAVNTTDISDYFFRGGFERFNADGTVTFAKPPHWQWLYAYSFISRLVFHNLLGYDRHFIPSDELENKTNLAMNALNDVMKQFSLLGIQSGFIPVAVIHPQFTEALNGSYLYPEFSETITAHQKLFHIDVLDAFNKRYNNQSDSIQNLYWPKDKHHTPYGYNIFSESVADGLQNILNTTSYTDSIHE